MTDDGRRSTYWRSAGLYLLGLALFLVTLYVRFPRFFYLDDKQLQYLPVFRWLGQAPGLLPPLLDPDQGMAGNFVADPQYGVLDPAHWLVYAATLLSDNLNTVSWVISVGAIVVLGLGVCAITTEYGVRPGWSAAGALAVSTSGWLLYVGASWWPMVWGTAFLPWLWWGVASRSRYGPVVAALAGYLVVASGYPYALPFAVAVVLAVMADWWLVDTREHRVLTRRRVGTLVCAAGGALAGSCNLIVASRLLDVAHRAGGAPRSTGNHGTFIPNFVDVVVGGTTLHGHVPSVWGNILTLPAFATAWFVLPLLAVVDWRRAVRQRGSVAAIVLVVVSVAATQLPTDVGTLRYPIRYLADVQLFLPVLTVLLLRKGMVLTPGRVLVAASLVGTQFLLAVARSPVFSGWHLAAAVLVAICLVVVLRCRRPERHRALAAVLVLSVALLPQVGAQAAVTAKRRLSTVMPVGPSPLPTFGAHDSQEWPISERGYRAAAWQPDLDATVVVPSAGVGPSLGLSRGILLGSANLFSGTQPGFGYTTVGQDAWAELWCADYLGQSGTCPDVARKLLRTAPGTDVTWLDVLAKDTLLLSDEAPESLRTAMGSLSTWKFGGHRKHYDVYVRTHPTPGRATWRSEGVRTLRPVSVGPTTQRYVVSIDAEKTQQVVFRDTWWPGYRATLDGRRIPTRPLEGAVVAVDLPPGRYEAELDVRYVPDGFRAGLVVAALGSLLVSVGLLLALSTIGPRRRRRTPVPQLDSGAG